MEETCSNIDGDKEVIVWRRVQMQSADGEGEDVSFATKTHHTCCI